MGSATQARTRLDALLAGHLTPTPDTVAAAGRVDTSWWPQPTNQQMRLVRLLIEGRPS